MTVVAVYDACVLFPAPLRNLLMRLAHASRKDVSEPVDQEFVEGGSVACGGFPLMRRSGPGGRDRLSLRDPIGPAGAHETSSGRRDERDIDRRRFASAPVFWSEPA